MLRHGKGNLKHDEKNFAEGASNCGRYGRGLMSEQANGRGDEEKVEEESGITSRFRNRRG